jgi:catechol 2,3-dioxygenase-like lactoylglutathione lyase family enzyme
MAMQIDHLDHLVLTVQNIQTTCAFYSRILGMQVITFEEGRKALRFGDQKINLHLKRKEIDPKAQHPTPGSADLCFLTSMPLEQVITHLQSCHVSVLLGPVKQTGATTSLVSLYFRDPDGNLLEVSNAC